MHRNSTFQQLGRASSRGFTLIELMAVIAIIGILSSVTYASLSGARERARDSERITEIGQIQVALEQYYDACGEYPSSLSTAASNGDCPDGVDDFGDFVGSTMPTQPGGASYGYAPGAGDVSYELSVTLEQNNAALDNDDCGTGLTYCLSS